ncbi:Methuselah-like protein 10, partial [Gryllus bimaculatus]
MVLTREIGWRGRLAGEPSQENVYYSALFASGALFLVATLLVHALLPELRRSPHAKALMCHCAALAVAFAALAAGHVLRVAAEPFCSASVLTLLMERINACKRGQRVSAQPPSAEGQRRRFLAYSLYAWGSPALLTAATLVLQYAAPQHLPLLPHAACADPAVLRDGGVVGDGGDRVDGGQPGLPLLVRHRPHQLPAGPAHLRLLLLEAPPRALAALAAAPGGPTAAAARPARGGGRRRGGGAGRGRRARGGGGSRTHFLRLPLS